MRRQARPEIGRPSIQVADSIRKNGAPEEIRTPDPQIRSLADYVLTRVGKQSHLLFSLNEFT